MSSKRRLRKSQCGEKIRFDRVPANCRAYAMGLGAYKCPFCHRWHIGHKSPLGHKF